MAITLKKGQKLSLSKEGLTKATVGLGWLVNQYDTGENADLDSSVFMLGEDGKVPSDAEFIYYNQPKHSSGADRKSTRLNSSHRHTSRMPSSA